MATSVFSFRPGGTAEVDADAINRAYDSALVHLAATGNEGQWGTQPVSEREGSLEEVVEELKKSENYRLKGEGEAKSIIMAEIANSGDHDDNLSQRTDDDGVQWLQVGNMELHENRLADYVENHADLKQYVNDAKALAGGFLTIDFLISDFRAGKRSKGVGKAMINYAKMYAVERGMKAVYLDCWVGGSRRILEHYESLGFYKVADFEFEHKGNMRKARVYRMDL